MNDVIHIVHKLEATEKTQINYLKYLDTHMCTHIHICIHTSHIYYIHIHKKKLEGSKEAPHAYNKHTCILLVVLN